MTHDDTDNPPLSADTEAILLLCGRFGSGRHEDLSPLTPKEYEGLIRWLLERKLRPSDLLDADNAVMSEVIQAKLDPVRINGLLRRGTALALSMEKWQRSGLWVLSRSDQAYPKCLKRKLGLASPPLLYGAGDPSLLDIGGVAIVGSRDVSEAGSTFTNDLVEACARDGLAIVSGGAKGVDATAMQAGGMAGVAVVGMLSSDLMRAAVNRQNRIGIQSGKLVLASPFNPEAGFNTGNAMARNRYIYALADYAVVVDSAEGEGGTWAGAIENLRHKWTPLYIRDADDKPGNKALIAKGGLRFQYSFGSRESIQAYFNLSIDQGAVVTLLEPESVGRVPNLSAEHGNVLKSAGEADLGVAVQIESAPQSSADAIDSPHDKFFEFMEHLTSLLQAGTKSDEEIRAALNLEKAQTKVWLARAVSQGLIEKQKKPVAYSLPKQTLLI